jgi:Recombination endonuclease VII
MPRMEAQKDDVWTKRCGRCDYVYEVNAKTWLDAQKAFLIYFQWASASSRTYDLLHSWCTECKNNRKHGREFGIQRKETLQDQYGKCGICCKEISFDNRTANVDHDHATGKLRKVLCRLCNVWMAAIDNEEWLEKAIAYRDSFRCE